MVIRTLSMLLFIVFYSFALSFTAEEEIPELFYLDAEERGEAEISVSGKTYRVSGNYASQTFIIIYKKQRILELYVNNKLLKSFKIALGKCPEGDKLREGDCRTPVGQYFICTRNEKSPYTLFLGLNYPNTKDAERGLQQNIISREIYEQIKAAEECRRRPPWNTPMGGEVGLHGGGNEGDWTRGCIALSDEDILFIGKYVKLNTPVLIYE